jgi:hypothetical protein
MMRSLSCFACLLAVSFAAAQAPAPIPDAQAGTLYPFLQAQVPAQFPLSFLNPRFTDSNSGNARGGRRC